MLAYGLWATGRAAADSAVQGPPTARWNAGRCLEPRRNRAPGPNQSTLSPARSSPATERSVTVAAQELPAAAPSVSAPASLAGKDPAVRSPHTVQARFWITATNAAPRACWTLRASAARLAWTAAPPKQIGTAAAVPLEPSRMPAECAAGRLSRWMLEACAATGPLTQGATAAAATTWMPVGCAMGTSRLWHRGPSALRQSAATAAARWRRAPGGEAPTAAKETAPCSSTTAPADRIPPSAAARISAAAAGVAW
mmetsp:Transcript_40426/g.114474  ORF Transcript_40426/g.114474 Transcript_40426/m.114474 type:complete len:254 (+) Transcript_40426:701-1462(+)